MLLTCILEEKKMTVFINTLSSTGRVSVQQHQEIIRIMTYDSKLFQK